MAAYKIRIKNAAAKELEAVGAIRDRRRIVARIEALAREPRPLGNEKLTGYEDRFRLLPPASSDRTFVSGGDAFCSGWIFVAVAGKIRFQASKVISGIFLRQNRRIC